MLNDLSRITRRLLTGDNRSWCAHAWEHQHRPFWRLWVIVWGVAHCERSWERYR